MEVGAVFWLEQAMAAESGAVACPPLAGAEHADFCVVGGGYTGLWTALELKEQAPDATVVVLEASGCGFGASGRNGGGIASGGGHLAALGVAHQAVQIERLPRPLAHELIALHRHAGVPEEDDVEARDQHVVG